MRFLRKSCRLTSMADLLCERASALAGNLDEAVIVGDLIEEREELLGLREDAFGEVCLKLQQRVVHP